MGISDWFKRFRQNASTIERRGETIIGPDEAAGESQADRAAHEGPRAPSESTAPREANRSAERD
jgi:hypothetical protein